MLLRSLTDIHLWTCDFSPPKIITLRLELLTFILFISNHSVYQILILPFSDPTNRLFALCKSQIFTTVNSASLFSKMRRAKITDSKRAHCRILLQKLSSVGRNLLIIIFKWFCFQFNVISQRSCHYCLYENVRWKSVKALLMSSDVYFHIYPTHKASRRKVLPILHESLMITSIFISFGDLFCLGFFI